jgi:hypothetical protein
VTSNIHLTHWECDSILLRHHPMLPCQVLHDTRLRHCKMGTSPLHVMWRRRGAGAVVLRDGYCGGGGVVQEALYCETATAAAAAWCKRRCTASSLHPSAKREGMHTLVPA